MRTFATLATAGSYSLPGQVLVGRTVANTQFLKALARYSRFESLLLFVGENRDLQDLQQLLSQLPSEWHSRFSARHLLELPRLLQEGQLDVLHHNTPGDKLFDLMFLRNQYATKTIPVTGQVHSLSYPRMPRDFLVCQFLQPLACDAVFCSSTAGQEVVKKMFAGLPGSETSSLELPVVPLGVDVEAVQGGNRVLARANWNLPENAFVVLSMARFSEYDKTDLFPLLQAFRSLKQSPRDAESPVYLLLAGARQGTQTPEMLQLWAKALGLESRLRLAVDFAEADKKQLLAASDVFVSPCDNVQETFGQSVVEALAAGLPVVVSDFNGYKDTVTPEVGFRVPTRLNVNWSELSEIAALLYERPLHLLLGQSVEVDLKALTQALGELHRQPNLVATMGKAARAHAASRFSWERVIPQYEAVWASLAQKPWQAPAKTSHPLRLSFGDVFSHYPTEITRTDRQTKRSALSYELWPQGQTLQYVVYPELKHLFTLEDVMPVLQAAETVVTFGFLVETARSMRPHLPEWVAQLMVGWMLKHGLLD